MNFPATVHRKTPSIMTVVNIPGTSVRSRIVSALIRAFARPVLVVFGRWPALPWPFRLVDLAGLLLPALRGTKRESIALPNCRAELITGPGARPQGKVILYLHGGGFLVCGLRTHRRLVSRLSTNAKIPALSVDYRMLPKSPISAAIDDALTGHRWLVEQGYSPENIVVAGDSAGGYLALATALALATKDLGKPAGVVCLSPVVDLFLGRTESPNRRSRDPLVPLSALEAVADIAAAAQALAMVGGAGEPIKDILSADLSTLPPVLIQTGSDELLAADSNALADRLAMSGVPGRLELWAGQIHVFPAGADFVPEGRTALRRSGDFIRSLPIARPQRQAESA
jgi:acetyl esterase/lipase